MTVLCEGEWGEANYRTRTTFPKHKFPRIKRLPEGSQFVVYGFSGWLNENPKTKNPKHRGKWEFKGASP